MVNHQNIDNPLGQPWLRSYPKDVKWHQEIQAKPLYTLIDEMAAKIPNNCALDFENKKLSYKELNEKICIAAKAFAEMGIKRGSKVALFLPNCPQYVISYFGILKAGGCVVNCSPLYSESEVEHLVKDSDSEFIITLNLKLLFPKSLAALKLSQKENGTLKKIIVGNLSDVLPFPKNLLFPLLKAKDISEIEYDENIIQWCDFCKKGENSNIDCNPDVQLDDTAVIQYTGGTTGTPKGAELSHRNIYINTMQSKAYCATLPDGEGISLIVLPLFHVFAMTTGLLFGVATGSCMILHPRFELEKVLKCIQAKKPTAMPGVPTMYNAINNFKDVGKYNLRSLQLCCSGGGALPIDVKQKFEAKTGCHLIEGYGLTETSPVVTCNPINALNKEGSIGLPLPQTQILIEDMENPDKYLGIGQRGELCIRGPQVMKGYYKRVDATAEVLQNGILKTGDVAMVDEDGYTFIVDRIKEMINSGGFKIYPRHVEEVLYQHPAILEAAVIGVKDDYSGEKVKAVIVFRSGAEVARSEIIDYCKKKLARHEVPKEIEVRESLPKSPVGKILKKELK